MVKLLYLISFGSSAIMIIAGGPMIWLGVLAVAAVYYGLCRLVEKMNGRG